MAIFTDLKSWKILVFQRCLKVIKISCQLYSFLIYVREVLEYNFHITSIKLFKKTLNRLSCSIGLHGMSHVTPETMNFTITFLIFNKDYSYLILSSISSMWNYPANFKFLWRSFKKSLNTEMCHVRHIWLKKEISMWNILISWHKYRF